MHANDIRPNNFDLVRLLAASQVLVTHSLNHLHLQPTYIELLSVFPGVPIFFVVSGFLIYQSYERSTSLRQFATNRFLRIYPALFVCFLVSLISVFLVSPSTLSQVRAPEFIIWIVGQLTVAQFYNPGFMREYGVGVLNGSLWTIPVELQFYAALPLLLCFTRPVAINKVLPLLCLAGLGSLAIALYYFHARTGSGSAEAMHIKLLGVFLGTHLWMFLIGVFAKIYWSRLQNLFRNKFTPWCLVYLSIALLSSYYPETFLLFITKNVLLACFTLSAAFSWTRISSTLLKGNDLSYGCYIYHMIILNVLVELGHVNSYFWFFVAIASTFGIAYLSWICVERPFLRKRIQRINPQH